MAEPMQLPLFPDRATLIRVRPERDEARFCQLELWPDLLAGRSSSATGAGSAPRADAVSTHTPTPGPRSTPSPAWRAPDADGVTGTATLTRSPGPGGGSRGQGKSEGAGLAHPPGRRRALDPGIHKAPSPPPAAMGLHTADGARKYLTAGERDAFLRAADEADRRSGPSA